jgi:hypothetical protein
VLDGRVHDVAEVGGGTLLLAADGALITAGP